MQRFLSHFRPRAARVSLGLPLALVLSLLTLPLLAGDALAHNVTEGDKGFILEITGIHLMPFLYLGAKHMAPATTICCSCWE